MEFLDFELPIKDIIDQIDKCKSIEDDTNVDTTKTLNLLQKKLHDTKKNIYSKLTPWQRVQLSRHPNRPYTLNYIKNILGDSFLELHGDRNVSDDKAMIGGLGKIDNQTFMIIGTQKGNNTKTRQYRNFGMANPEGYRKALRLMKHAEKFNIPIISNLSLNIQTQCNVNNIFKLKKEYEDKKVIQKKKQRIKINITKEKCLDKLSIFNDLDKWVCPNNQGLPIDSLSFTPAFSGIEKPIVVTGLNGFGKF